MRFYPQIAPISLLFIGVIQVTCRLNHEGYTNCPVASGNFLAGNGYVQ